MDVRCRGSRGNVGYMYLGDRRCGLGGGGRVREAGRSVSCCRGNVRLGGGGGTLVDVRWEGGW